MERRERAVGGGIFGLLDLIAGHEGAVEYDLMTKAHATLDDVPGRIPWRALSSFVRHLGADSALYREMRPERGGWSRTDTILADVFDALQECTRTVAAAHSTRRPKRAKPYPRPWAKERGTKTVGRGAVSVADFEAFWSDGGKQKD